MVDSMSVCEAGSQHLAGANLRREGGNGQANWMSCVSGGKTTSQHSTCLQRVFFVWVLEVTKIITHGRLGGGFNFFDIFTPIWGRFPF